MIVITIARKPLDGTVANNVLAHGTGGINVDGSRVGTDLMNKGGSNGVPLWKNASHTPAINGRCVTGRQIVGQIEGRWPSNMILSTEVAKELDVQSGETTSSNNPSNTSGFRSVYVGGTIKEDVPRHGYADTGGASRFYKVLGGSE